MSRLPFPTTPVPGWDLRFPWLRAGTTRRVLPGLHEMLPFTGRGRWRAVARSRQVHGSAVHVHADARGGVIVVGDGDGHVTAAAGLLLTVTVADCVPVFIADPAGMTVGLLHAGWRGTAAGILESGIRAMTSNFGSIPAELAVHLGPAICGDCYEVGPEVFRSLGERPPPGPRPVDLRRVLRRRAVAAGLRDEYVAVSDECTLCGDGRYFSHRRGDTGRQRAFVGIVPWLSEKQPAAGSVG